MKNYITSIFRKLALSALTSALAAGVSNAANTWYYDYTKGGSNPTWESTLGSGESTGAWYKLGEDGSTRTYITGVDSYDKLNDTFSTKWQTGDNWSSDVKFKLTSSSVIEVGALEFGGSVDPFRMTRLEGGGKIIVNGNMTLLAGFTSILYGPDMDIYVGGNLDVKGGGLFLSFDKDIKRLEVMGNVKAETDIYLAVNGNAKSRGADDSFQLGLANPDVIIHGAVDSVRGVYSKADTVNSYYQIGGISNRARIMREAMANAGTGKNTISYIILTNEADYSTKGDSSEVNSRIWADHSGKLCFVMNGTKSQTFEGNSMAFRGGVKAMSGGIYINFNQKPTSSNDYSWFRDAAKKVSVMAVKNDGDDASKITTFSHGDLEMLGGVFGSSAGTSSYGSLRFTNIKYTNGSIKLRLDSETQMDSIDLTSYYLRVEDSTSGTKVVSYEQVLGGAVIREGVGKVTFDFGTELPWWLFDDGYGDFSINGGLGAKIIAWDAGKGIDLSASDFVANVYSNSGDDYAAEFTICDDGLYVKYVVVPEAATLAAIFGVLALSFTIYRRRK